MNNLDRQPTSLTTFEIESEYQEQIAPIDKKLARLKKSHETKSLRLHKGFLTKEKKAKNKINKLDSESEKANTKLEATLTSKLAQLNKIDHSIKKEQNEKIRELEDHAQVKIIEYQEEIDLIRDDLHQEHGALHQEYLKNVHVYQEKLASYEQLSKDKQKLYNKTYQDYIKALETEFNDVASFTSNLQKTLDQSKKAFLKDIQKHIEETSKDQNAAKKEAGKTHHTLSKKTLNYTKKIEQFVDQIKASYVNHYQPMLTRIKEQEILIKDNYQTTINRLKEDFRFRTEDEDTLIEQTSKTHEKNHQKRLLLFEQRMELYSQIEDTVKDRKLAILSFEHTSLRHILDQEMTNLDKLEVFLKKDFDEIKQYSNHIHQMENNLFDQMDQVHQTLHEQSNASSKMLASFIQEFNHLMLTFEQSLITMIKEHLEQLHEKNKEIDRLDKEIDLSEPQKEIALNEFEENLALEEIKNRFQIKILNKEHEIDLVKRHLKKDIQVTVLQYEEKRLDNDFDITCTKMKHDTKMAIEHAKHKAARAKEVFHLRENALKHDEKQALLTLETNIKKLEIKKEKAPFEAEKSLLLLQKEASQSNEQLLQRQELQTRMVTQKYQEQIKEIEQQQNELKKQQDTLKETTKSREQKLHDVFTIERNVVTKESKAQLDKLQEALQRELRIPENNLSKWKEFQNKTTVQLEKALSLYEEHFTDYFTQYQVIEDLEHLQTQFDDDILITNTTNTIFGLYDAYIKTVETLFTISKETLQDQAALNIDTSMQKKLAKDLERRIKEFEKELQIIKKARDQHVKSYVVSLNDDLRKLHKQKFMSTSSFLEALQTIHQETSDALTQLKGELIKEIDALFHPITLQDKQVIQSAINNHAQAKSKLEEDRQNRLRPIDVREKQAIDELYNEEQSQNADLLEKLETLENRKTFLLQTQEKELSTIQKRYQDELIPHEEYLQTLEEARERAEVETLEKLDNQLTKLQQEEPSIKQTYEEKIEEAKAILLYEEKIEQSTIDHLKEKEQEQLNRKQKIIDEEKAQLEKDIEQAAINLELAIKDLHETLYQTTTILGHENDLTKPKIQKELQELKSTFEAQEELHQDALLESKKMVRQMIESFDQQLRVSYNDFFDQLNQTIEKMKSSYSKTIHQEIRVFDGLHKNIFATLESSYQDMLTSMKTHNLELTKSLHRLNKNLS